MRHTTVNKKYFWVKFRGYIEVKQSLVFEGLHGGWEAFARKSCSCAPPLNSSSCPRKWPCVSSPWETALLTTVNIFHWVREQCSGTE